MYFTASIYCFHILHSKPVLTLTDLEHTRRTEVKLVKSHLAGSALSSERVTAVFTTSVWMQGHSISITQAGEQSNRICNNVVQLDNWLILLFTDRKQQGCLVIILIEIAHHDPNKHAHESMFSMTISIWSVC